MKLHFFEPPPAARVGGLEAAIRSLESALKQHGASLNAVLPTTADGSVAHFHGLWQPAHARLSRQCRARRIPYVVSPHGMLEPWAWRHRRWKKWPYFQLVERRHLRGAACLLATAGPEAARLRELFPGQRVEALPLGLTGAVGPDYGAARAALGWGPDELVLLFLSRLHVKKGLDLLLRALAESPAIPSRARLVIVGGGEARYVASLRALAAELAPRLPRVEWIGEVWGEARWKYFQGADLFCLPTHSENFGLAVLEACAAGTPVLTTNATPWAGLLPKRGGYLCEPDGNSIAVALARFFREGDWPARERAAMAGWAGATFAWEQLAPRYLDLYRSCVASVAR